jgi:hypothetical protein
MDTGAARPAIDAGSRPAALGPDAVAAHAVRRRSAVMTLATLPALAWHRVDHAWKLALLASIATDCA